MQQYIHIAVRLTDLYFFDKDQLISLLYGENIDTPILYYNFANPMAKQKPKQRTGLLVL